MAETTTTFRIEGLDSDDDLAAVREALEVLEGVMGASIDADGEARVRIDQDLLAVRRVELTVEDLGYDVVS